MSNINFLYKDIVNTSKDFLIQSFKENNTISIELENKNIICLILIPKLKKEKNLKDLLVLRYLEYNTGYLSGIYCKDIEDSYTILEDFLIRTNEVDKVNIIETEINIKDYNVKFIQRKLERPIFPISIEEDIYYAKDIYIVSEDVLEALKEFYPSMGGRIFSPDNKINIIENLNGEVLFVTRLITF